MDMNANDERSRELDKMLAENAMEVETKRRSLTEERMSIEKSMGTGTWEPTNLNPVNAYGSKKKRKGF